MVQSHSLLLCLVEPVSNPLSSLPEQRWSSHIQPLVLPSRACIKSLVVTPTALMVQSHSLLLCLVEPVSNPLSSLPEQRWSSHIQPLVLPSRACIKSLVVTPTALMVQSHSLLLCLVEPVSNPLSSLPQH